MRTDAREVQQRLGPCARREKLESFEHRYEAVFRGNDCVELTPGGEYYTLFQRDHYRLDRPRYAQVRRFACENTINY